MDSQSNKETDLSWEKLPGSVLGSFCKILTHKNMCFSSFTSWWQRCGIILCLKNYKRKINLRCIFKARLKRIHVSESKNCLSKRRLNSLTTLIQINSTLGKASKYDNYVKGQRCESALTERKMYLDTKDSLLK